MIDPGTGLTILGSAIGGAKVLEKILGPTSEYIGEQIREWTKKRIENTTRIFQNAEKKIGENINNDEQVPSKVLKGILEEGAWCEDELQIEYFGGVLASSRSNIPRDDRGAYFISLISRLSTYQVRTHYLLYKAIKDSYDGEFLNVADSLTRNKIRLFFPYSSFNELMDFNESEDLNTLVAHSIWGLHKEFLIDEDFWYGGFPYLKERFPNVTEGGIVFRPTKMGCDLLMWAFGYGKLHSTDFFKKEIIFDTEPKLEPQNLIKI